MYAAFKLNTPVNHGDNETVISLDMIGTKKNMKLVQ